MKIASLGAGAMGSLFGGYLSQKNEVCLIEINQGIVEKINRYGVKILRNGEERVLYPKATADSSGIGCMDLVIIFVKSMHTRNALSQNKHLIGGDTYVMTLQNGAGHEQVIAEFVPPERIIIGTTEHNSSIVEPGCVHHGGGGKTTIGLCRGDSSVLQPIVDSFSACGLPAVVTDDVEKAVWKKLLINISASVLTAVLQVKLGYILSDEHAWAIAQTLIREAVAVAKAKGIDLDAEQSIADVKALLAGAKDGYTSIFADLRDGRRSEVDTINGYVVSLAKKLQVPAPSHEFVVNLVHALEGKKKQ